MSFNLTDLKKTNPDNQAQISNTTYHQKVVLGSDFFSVARFLQLKKQFGENVRLIGNKDLAAKHILKEIQGGIRRIRSEEEAALIKELFPKLEVVEIESEAKFYKDGEVKVFGGKAKPMELLDGEEVFATKSFEVDCTELISSEDWNSLDEILGKFYLNKEVIALKRVDNTDLAEPRNFEIMTGDNLKILTEEIFYYNEVQDLLSLFSNKEDVSDEMVTYFSSFKTKAALQVDFTLEKKIEEDQGTFLFPRSQTHEWGHFIFEFKEIENKQHLLGLILIHEEDIQEEDLAKKIRAFKTTLKRYYSELETVIEGENILYHQEYLQVSSFKEEVQFDHFSLEGALKSDTRSLSFLTRPFISLA